MASQWNGEHPEYPVAAMTARQVTEARLAAAKELLVEIDGF